MANIFDYLNWRGDLKISQADFNNIDALILSRLSYIPFDGIVRDSFSDKISIGKAADFFFTLESPSCNVIMAEDTKLLEVLANSDRFRDMLLSGYVNEMDFETQKQFAAIVIDIEDNSHFISFRGTDNSLIGWKEDFNMSFMTPVPAQEDAVCYFEKAADAVTGNIILGGHSKGGNLAVYAASFCSEPVQKRIIKVYNNDGPGFHSEVITQKGYADICGKIKTFVPQSSVIGMLLEHEEVYTIVHSIQTGFLQHDLYSWQIERDNFVYLDAVTNSSKFIDRTLKDWMMAVEPKQREQFIDAVFTVFSDTDAKTLSELTSNWYRNARLVLRSFRNMDESLRKFTSQTLFLLIKSAKRNLSILRAKQ